jgi:hypothetical protein
MRGLFPALAAAGLLAGCAVSKDGLGPAPRTPTASQVAQSREQLERNAGGVSGAPEQFPGILVVGTTGPLRSIEDKDRAGFFSAYLEEAGRWHPGAAPSMDEATFQETLGGWASVQTFSIAGIMNRRMRVLVPASMVPDTQFASAAGSVMFGTTGDLVAARSDRDGLLWLERVLCRDGAGYRPCATNYQLGIFDENTGQELGRNRKPKPAGASIDVSSYLKISQEATHHTASELDVRGADHCDCNRALPGSTQSSVHVPEVDN